VSRPMLRPSPPPSALRSLPSPALPPVPPAQQSAPPPPLFRVTLPRSSPASATRLPPLPARVPLSSAPLPAPSAALLAPPPLPLVPHPPTSSLLSVPSSPWPVSCKRLNPSRRSFWCTQVRRSLQSSVSSVLSTTSIG
jgi:hypothetical protein